MASMWWGGVKLTLKLLVPPFLFRQKTLFLQLKKSPCITNSLSRNTTFIGNLKWILWGYSNQHNTEDGRLLERLQHLKWLHTFAPYHYCSNLLHCFLGMGYSIKNTTRTIDIWINWPAGTISSWLLRPGLPFSWLQLLPQSPGSTLRQSPEWPPPPK